MRWDDQKLRVRLSPGDGGRTAVRLPVRAAGQHALTVTFVPDATTAASLGRLTVSRTVRVE